MKRGKSRARITLANPPQNEFNKIINRKGDTDVISTRGWRGKRGRNKEGEMMEKAKEEPLRWRIRL